MALTVGNFVGFEADDKEALAVAFDSYSSANSRTGKRFSADSSDGYYRIDPFANGTDQGNDHIVGFALYVDSAGFNQFSGANLFTARENSSDANIIMFLQLRKDGSNLKLALWDSASLLSQGTTTITLDTWHYIEIHWPRVNSGTATLFLNNNSELTLLGDFTDGLTFTDYELRGNALSLSTHYFDDFYCMSGAASASDRLGDCEVFTLFSALNSAVPDGPGQIFGPTNLDVGLWSNTGTLDEVATAEYDGSTKGGADHIAFPAGVTEDPIAQKSLFRIKRTGGGGSAHYGVLGDTISEVRTSDFDPATAYATYTDFRYNSSWIPLATETPVLGLEISGGGQDLICAWMFTSFLHVPVSVGVTHEGDVTGLYAKAVTSADGSKSGFQLADVSTLFAKAVTTANATKLGVHLGGATATGIAAIAPPNGPVATTILGVVNLRMTGYQFRKHFGAEMEHRPMQPNNTGIDAIADVDYALRVVMENQGLKDGVIQYYNLEYRKNAGAWTQVSTTSTDIKCNQDPVRFFTGPGFAGDVYASGFTSDPLAFVESPAGTLHKLVWDESSGICGSQNDEYVRYQRSPDYGTTWGNTKIFIGDNYTPGDPDCEKSRLHGFAANRAGTEMAIWFWNTYDSTEGDFGMFKTSNDNGVTWNTQYPFDEDPGVPTVDYGPGVGGLMMQEDGTLYVVIWDYFSGTKGPTLPDDYVTRHYLAVYKSINDGQTWTYNEVVNDYLYGFGTPERTWQIYGALADRDTDDLYIFMRDGDDLDVWKSTDNNANWSVVSTVWTFADNDTVEAWNGTKAQCITPNGEIIVSHMAKYLGTDARLYVKYTTSIDGGLTWTPEKYIGSEPPDEPWFDGGYINIACPLEKGDGHTSALVASFPIYNGLTEINPWGTEAGYTDNLGPTWFRTESGGLWTGPHTTRVAREETWYEDTLAGNGYMRTTASHLLIIDGIGNTHLLFHVAPTNYTPSKTYYDAEAVYVNTEHSRLSAIGGAGSGRFDVTNHCYSLDGTLGPNRLRALSYFEADIRLRPDSVNVTIGDTIEFRINGLNNDVVPTMTIAATEKVWPGTTGTIVTAGAVARGVAEISADSIPLYAKNADAVSLPAIIAASTSLIPKGRKSGPFLLYETDVYYALLYTTGPTQIQFYSGTVRDGTWAAVGTAIGISAADSVWAEQGRYGYEHMIYVLIQDDTNGDVDFYEFDTGTDTMSTVVNLHSPSPTPLVACVTMALRLNGSTPQIVCGYNAQRSGTSQEQCQASVRDCGGSTWTNGIVIDGRASVNTVHWMNPTMVEGSKGLVHVFFCSGANNTTTSYDNGIFAHTLRPSNALSTFTGIANIQYTGTDLNTDVEPPGQAAAWFRNEDTYEVRLAFCWRNTTEIDALSCYEGTDGDITFRSNNILVIADGDNNHTAGTNDTANMVMISNNGDADPETQSNYFLFINGGTLNHVRMSFDEDSYTFAGYITTLPILTSSPTVSRVRKVSGSYIQPGGGSLYLGVIFEEPTGVLYDEYELIPPTIQVGEVTHNGSATAPGVGAITNAYASKELNASSTSSAIADIQPVTGTRVAYDPIRLASATATGVAATSGSMVGTMGASGTVTAKAVVSRARGGKPISASATVTAVATVDASPIKFLPVLKADTPINVLVIRGEGLEENVENALITSVLVAIEHGRNFIDENGQLTRETTLTVLYEDNFKSGQIISIEDAIRGNTYIGKIVSVSHNATKIASATVTKLEVRVPLDQ